MKVNRLELLGALKALSPAIAGAKSVIQEMSHVWFDGTHASAFNDVLGIQIDFTTEFTGGLLGEKLIGALERSRVKEITIETEDGGALLKIGNAKIKMACRPIEDWFWSPEIPTTDSHDLTQSFKDAIDSVLLSVGSTTVLNPEQRGITVIQNGKVADLYSTDAVSMSWMRIESDSGLIDKDTRVILPTAFCEQLKALKSEAQLRFDDGAVYCSTTIKVSKEEVLERNMVVFSKLVDDETPVAFDAVVKQHYINNIDSDIPTQLKLRAERAMVFITDQPVELEVADNTMYLYAQTPYGEVDDAIKFGNHPDIKVKIDIALLRRALDKCNKMFIGEQGIVLLGSNNFTHIVATK